MPGLSELASVTRAYKAALASRERAQMADMAARYVMLQDHVQTELETLSALVAQMQAAGTEVAPGTLWRLTEWKTLQLHLAAEYSQYQDFAEQSIVANKVAWASLGADQAKAQLMTMLGEGTVSALLNTFNPLAVESMAAKTAAGPLADLLSAGYGQMSQAMGDALVKGVAAGLNPVAIARQCQQKLGVGLDRTLCIARTEELGSYRDACLGSYAATGLVSRYMRVSAHDEATCIGCLCADGDIYDMDVEFDDHPNCRCTCVPILDGENPADVQAQMGGDGESWFNSLSPDQQQDMMGPGRYDLYSNGDVGWDQLASRSWDDTWGGSIVPTTVGDLQDGLGGVPVDGSPTPDTPLPSSQMQPELGPGSSDSEQ